MQEVSGSIPLTSTTDFTTRYGPGVEFQVPIV